MVKPKTVKTCSLGMICSRDKAGRTTQHAAPARLG